MKYFFLFLLLAVSTSFLFAENNAKTFRAVRTTTPPVINGFEDDEVWKQANIADGFIQNNPDEGQAATEKTEVKILFDDNNIYLFAMMYDSDPNKIAARLARRDNTIESDYFAVGFDSYYDKQTAFIFQVYASGSKIDVLNFNDGRDEDYSWDPVWDSHAQLLPNGWSVEMKIPLSQIRFTEGNDTWGVNFVRKISRTQEESHWMLMKKGVAGAASLFGTMTGMSDVKLPPQFEVLPYAVGSSEHYPQTPAREKIEKIRPDAGVDIKYGVTSNFTLDATFNPDFAQVEADPEVLNLTTFETFYPEKRPFFIEGTQIIRFVTFGGDFGPGLFYSRRIGKAITVNLPGDGRIITDEPRSVAILGAAKLSGKTENGTSIGVLTALTNEEDFTYQDTLGNSKTVLAEPTSSYNLFRVKQDFWGSSNIGGIITATAHNGKNPAYTAGADWDIKFDNNNYRFNGFFAHSKSIMRFIPSLGEVGVGNAGKANFARVNGTWVYGVSYDFTSRGYYINDIGFYRSPNDHGIIGNVAYRNYTPGDIFRSYNFTLVPHIRWNYDRLLLFKQLEVDAFGQLLNYWSMEGSVQYSLSAKDPYEARKLGAYNAPASYFVRGEIESDNREPIIVNLEDNFRRNEKGGTINNVAGTLIVRPTPSMEYRVSLGYATDRALASFANITVDSNITFAPSLPVVVFGERDVDGTDLTLRGSILFTNELSLQVYNQFFWAKGHYKNFSVLQPDGNLQPYAYTENVDFNRTSFISNVVLRWEYREGSTFYFVWSHGRSFFQPGGYSTSLSQNIDNTFLVAPDNTYVMKVSYWLSL